MEKDMTMDETNGQPHGTASERETPDDQPSDPRTSTGAEQAVKRQERDLASGEENAT
jgi:hypothetical protein